MTASPATRIRATYEGGPIDGHCVVFFGLGNRRWARYTDPVTGTQHYYERVWRGGEWVFVYQPDYTK